MKGRVEDDVEGKGGCKRRREGENKKCLLVTLVSLITHSTQNSHFLFSFIVCLLLKVCSAFISQLVQKYMKLCIHSFHSTVVQSGYGIRKASATSQMEGIDCYQLKAQQPLCLFSILYTCLQKASRNQKFNTN